MIRTEEEHLAHYGIIRRSGRYPWGSGDAYPEATRSHDWLSSISAMKKKGMTDKQIYEGQGMNSTQFRVRKSEAREQVRRAKILTAHRHAEDGWSPSEIGRRMGLNESSVRALLRDDAIENASSLERTKSMLERQVDEKTYVDTGKGVEAMLGITYSKLNSAVVALREKGYVVHNVYIPQLGMPGQYTTMRVLAKPGTDPKEIDRNRNRIQQIKEQSPDYGQTYIPVQPPLSVSSRRVGVNYKEDGGAALDGVIYIRPGVKDLSIGENRYGQVRIMVDNTHYLKGMAVYNDKLPDGIDIVMNTNKSSTGRKKDVMKPLEKDLEGNVDPLNPFGALIRQHHDETGKVDSALNMVGSPSKPGSGEEGSWETWRKGLSSQMLSKQDPRFAQQQLDVTYDKRLKEFYDIQKLTNPTVKKDLLEKFGDETDSAAVDLQAASLRRTATSVLLPLPSMKSTEVYAPRFRDGETVVLIRHPHGGTFEIPQLKVNNKNREGQRIIGPQALDAIGINEKVAQHLSGADFDGDTVLVIPNKGGQIKVTPALESLKKFDPMVYAIPKNSSIAKMDKQQKQKEMGRISNLITDMSLQGADIDHIVRAVKHSMVVIDAEKHGLNYKASEKDHGILALKQQYQKGSKKLGASTLISKAGSPRYIDQRRPRRKGGPIDPATGKKMWEPTGKMRKEYVKEFVTDPTTGRKVKDPVTGKPIPTGKKVSTGRMIPRQEKFEKLALTDDAFSLVSESQFQMEVIYANHSNKLKALANNARKEAVPIKSIPYSPSARKVYKEQYETIKAKIRLAEQNKPYERQAQLLGNLQMDLKRQANPGMLPEQAKRERTRVLTEERARTGANKHKIDLTQDEWDAIQAGAISKDMLEKVLRDAVPGSIRKLAMPKTKPIMTTTMRVRAEAMLAKGYTQQQVADQLGIGLTTLKVGISE